jgi:hypothetical protein
VVDYTENPLKTDHGQLISSYECAPETADLEFALAYKQYQSLTGRNQGKRAVVAYHARQSFAPGEITPEEANRLGYELATRFTKGRHALIVCTHVDKRHIHNHIVWSSVTLDCRRKYRDFFRSAFALRKVNDMVCLENGYSIIENPKPSPGRDYAKHVFGGERAPSFQSRLRAAIDDALAKSPASFENFIALVRAEGIAAERRGKHLRFKLPEQKQWARLETLGGDYTEDAIRERVSGRRIVLVPAGKSVTAAPEIKVPNLLIDIERKIREGKGAGYERWSKGFNLKQMARTLIFLQERGLDSYDALRGKSEETLARYHELSARIRDLEDRLSANSELQKHIVAYSKTRTAYVEYRKSGYSRTFRSTHESDIILHQAAKRFFDEHGFGKGNKIPTVASLRAEYAPLLEEKKRAYAEYQQARDEMKGLLIAKSNVDRLLNIADSRNERSHERGEI